MARSPKPAVRWCIRPDLYALNSDLRRAADAEPTAGMGEHETFAVANLIRRLHKNSAYTIVLIEHDMRVVFNLADKITVLGEGKMLAEGTPAEIADNPIVQEAYLGKAE